MEISIEFTCYNFNAASKILNIQNYTLVKEKRTLETVDFIILGEFKVTVITQSLRNTQYLSICIHIDKARAFYYNERICVILQGLIHEEVGLVYDSPLILVIHYVKTWPIYNHSFAKP